MNVDVNIISLAKPIFAWVSKKLFEEVKSSYGKEVVEVVREVAEDHMEDVVLLIKHMLPEMATTLARQRWDYGLDEKLYSAQFLVEKQANEIDDTPTNNMDNGHGMFNGPHRPKIEEIADSISSI